jgi:magnesium transporter
VVRGIATGRINVRHLWIVISKEMAIGLILGLFYGLFLGTFVQFQFGREALALSVAIGVLSSMSMAALMGAFMPMMCARMNIDPAVATGPFITSFVDILSVSIYFQVATILLGI